MTAPGARGARANARVPAWDERAMALVERGRLRAVSQAAAQRRVRVGMTLPEARGVCAELETREWDDIVVARAMDRVTAALLEAAHQVTPATGMPGTWWAGAMGFDRLGGERRLLRDLLRVARRWHPGVRVAVAGSCVAAYAATWGTEGRRGTGTIVPVGADAAYLSSAPLALVPMDAEMRAALQSLGMRSAGALAALDPGDVERRWGAVGMAAWRLARGEDARRPVLVRADGRRVVEVELASPADTTEPVLFFIVPALERLARELVEDGRAAAVVAITLTLDGARSALPTTVHAHTVTREVRLPRPVARVGPLREHCRALLETWPVAAPIWGVAIAIPATAPLSGEQGDLLDTTWHDPQAADAAFARLRAELGAGVVVRAAARDAHPPERAGAWVDAWSADAAARDDAASFGGSSRNRASGGVRGAGRGASGGWSGMGGTEAAGVPPRFHDAAGEGHPQHRSVACIGDRLRERPPAERDRLFSGDTPHPSGARVIAPSFGGRPAPHEGDARPRHAPLGDGSMSPTGTGLHVAAMPPAATGACREGGRAGVATLRLLDPPEPAEVEHTAGIPVAVWWRGRRLTIERATGPERMSGAWWADPYARDYWRCEGAEGELLVFLDGRERGWYVQGWID